MSYGVFGVSGGQAVTAPVSGGFTLSQAGDFALFYLQQASPAGPDNAGFISLGGANQGESLFFEQVGAPVGPANQWAGNWVPVPLATRSDTGSPVTSPFYLPVSGQSVVVQPASLAGVYAVRVRLGSITGGTVLADGSFTAGGTAALIAGLLTAQQASNGFSQALVFGVSQLVGEDLFSTFGLTGP